VEKIKNKWNNSKQMRFQEQCENVSEKRLSAEEGRLGDNHQDLKIEF